jgi:hypothetical protein
MKKTRFWKTTMAALLTIAGVPAMAYDHQISDVPVGWVRSFGNSGGLMAFSRADGAAFPGCTTDTTTMWIDANYATLDGRKSLLAMVLSAKLSGGLIRIYYTTADGYCRAQIIDVQ